MKKLLIVVIILVILAALSIVSVTTKSRITDSAGLSYQELCVKNGDQWMMMEPWRDGKKIGGESCSGCMVGGNHYCAQEEYIDHIRKMNSDSDMQNSMSEIVIEFEVLQKGKPVNNIDVVHEKIMHLVLVREDLKYFDHVHPEKTGEGKYSVPYEFLSGGSYRLWTDFTA